MSEPTEESTGGGQQGHECPECGHVEHAGIESNGILHEGMAFMCSECGTPWKEEFA